ncbi:MAG: PaaI family thioesterase [Thermocrispum sp.]
MTEMPKDADEPDHAAMVNTALEFTIPVAHGMGVRAVEVRAGYACAEVPIDGNGNHFGVMYAGVLFTVAEVLGGAIGVASFDNAQYYPLVKDLQITFRRPAKTAVRAATSLEPMVMAAVAEEAAKEGKADFELDTEVTDADGTVVATTHGVYQLRRFDT